MKKKSINDYESESIINWLCDRSFGVSLEQYYSFKKEILDFHSAHHGVMKNGKQISLIEFVKMKLGKQDYVWQGSNKNWVWQTDEWRLFVSTRGLGFEVKTGSSYEQYQFAWDDIRTKLGITI